jgi:hypothetical protein
MDVVLGVRYCPVAKMTLCVTSEPEMEKCSKMKVNILIKSINYNFLLICY